MIPGQDFLCPVIKQTCIASCCVYNDNLKMFTYCKRKEYEIKENEELKKKMKEADHVLTYGE